MKTPLAWGTWAAALLGVAAVSSDAQGTASPNVTLAAAHGMQVFQATFTASRGLGPEFNAVSCVSCHNVPTLGGGGSGRHTFVEWSYGDAGDMLGRPRQRFALTRNGTVARAAVSDEFRRPPTLLGLGLLEAIPLEELRRRIDPRDADRDGISGRLPWRDESRQVPVVLLRLLST